MVVNLFKSGSLPTSIYTGIVSRVKGWFPISPENTTEIEITKVYVKIDIMNYFWAMFGIILVYGIFLNLLPTVKNFVESVVSNALDLNVTANLELLS